MHYRLMVIVSVVVVLVCGVTDGVAQVSDSERAALLALHQSTGGDEWTNNDGWTGPPGTECTWFGVGCADGGGVVSVELLDNNLDGTLPDELSALTNLQHLAIPGNRLTGDIPDAIGELVLLQGLDLARNRLSGTIPSWIGNLDQLELLLLAHNQLTGAIPESIGEPTLLLQLDLSVNQLEGSIPGEVSNLANLGILALADNHLSGEIPPGFGNLENLGTLLLHGNALGGTIPSELGQLANLDTLALAGNQLGGALPPELGNLTNLTGLWLSENQLEGPVPVEYAQLVNLRWLALTANPLTGSIPAFLADMSGLEQVFMGGCRLTGTIPPDLGDLTSLQELFFDNNRITGEIPSELGNLDSLLAMSLGGNRLTGTIPSELGNLASLELLWLGQNQLTGTIPTELGAASELRLLEVSGNQLTGTLPVELADLDNLAVLLAGSNLLTGTIPPELGDVEGLAWVWLVGNGLTGTIPPELGRLENLEALLLEVNALSGTIPPELGVVDSLAYLALGLNELTGTIPSELGNLEGLAHLSVGGNHLSGSIPSELGDLVGLETLDLRSNQLTGDLPSSLGNLVALEEGGLDLRWNGLYTSDELLAGFLSRRQIDADWVSTQTVAPPSVAIADVGQDTVELTWEPIVYTWDEGGYVVGASLTAGGPYQSVATTANKADTGAAVTGLDPGTTYYFVLQTVTTEHASNANEVTSEPSAEVSATTRAEDECAVTCAATVPARAELGETVAFTATATVTNCTGEVSYAWDFGDGQVSADQNPNHGYVALGTYEWGLVVSADDVSCVDSGDLAVFAPDTECGNGVCEIGETSWTCWSDCGLGAQETGRAGESATLSAVPAAVGGIGGVGDTYWVTEAMIHNPGTAAASVDLHFTPDNQPGQVTTVSGVSLAAGGAAFYANFVEELFGVNDNGSVRISSDVPVMFVSRTFNDTSQGSYGQFLGAVSASRALSVGDAVVLAGLREDDDFRTNVIFQEMAGIDTDVRLTVLSSAGNLVGTALVDVPGITKVQKRLLNLDTSAFSDLESAYGVVEVLDGGQIVTIASVVDQVTGDAMTVDALHPAQAALAVQLKALPDVISTTSKELTPAGPAPSHRAVVKAGAIGFTWSPSSPIVGETVQFTDESTGDNNSWSWSFGDGAQSTVQNPTHVYSQAGTYSVTLAVSSSVLGSQFATKTITVRDAPTSVAHFVVAVVARLAGDQNTLWRSDMWLVNPFAATQQVWLEYRPEASQATHREQIVVLSYQQLAIEDVVATMFPDVGDGKGSLHVYAPVGLFISSRTFNQGVGGTFGQAIPALAGGDLLEVGDTGRLLKLKSTSTARCNVGFTEFEGVDTTVDVELVAVVDGSMESLATKTYTVSAYENFQVNRVFSNMGLTGDYEEALAFVTVPSGGAIYAYASNVDGRTGDGEFIPAMKE